MLPILSSLLYISVSLSISSICYLVYLFWSQTAFLSLDTFEMFLSLLSLSHLLFLSSVPLYLNSDVFLLFFSSIAQSVLSYRFSLSLAPDGYEVTGDVVASDSTTSHSLLLPHSLSCLPFYSGLSLQFSIFVMYPSIKKLFFSNCGLKGTGRPLREWKGNQRGG